LGRGQRDEKERVRRRTSKKSKKQPIGKQPEREERRGVR